MRGGAGRSGVGPSHRCGGWGGREGLLCACVRGWGGSWWGSVRECCRDGGASFRRHDMPCPRPLGRQPREGGGWVTFGACKAGEGTMLLQQMSMRWTKARGGTAQNCSFSLPSPSQLLLTSLFPGSRRSPTWPARPPRHRCVHTGHVLGCIRRQRHPHHRRLRGGWPEVGGGGRGAGPTTRA